MDVTLSIKRESPCAVRREVTGDDGSSVCLKAEDRAPSFYIPNHHYTISVAADRIVSFSVCSAVQDIRGVAGELADESKAVRVIHVDQIVSPRNEELGAFRAAK